MSHATGGILLAIVLSLCALVFTEHPCEQPDGTIAEVCGE